MSLSNQLHNPKGEAWHVLAPRFDGHDGANSTIIRELSPVTGPPCLRAGDVLMNLPPLTDDPA